ncbi:hypothetical protein GCM10010912_35940 [Paenibacillus albidus]|uniref:Uncharacterized protein n=1 Tax=Paenibacillus albidus TaxID=2041023 RepID=A0A917CG20_9BACL|nr:hypothetical protein [Paenibacillus albidus]GGF87475.1 hypothetical protein GCM10010912_35940 [Paenibacillus albidus]
MKPVWKVSMAAVLLGGAVWVGSLVNLTAEGAGVGSQPGTADDPVVTKSYVDQQIQKALQGGTVTAPSATPPVATTAPSASVPPVASTPNESVIVDVKPGQTLIASAGAEFIVRAGKAVIFSEDANGVADLTDGVDLANGVAATSNHLLSFPRNGRGIKVQEGQTLGLVVMVRGGYTLK